MGPEDKKKPKLNLSRRVLKKNSYDSKSDVKFVPPPKLDPTYPKGNPVVMSPGQGFEGNGLGLAEQIARVREQIGLAAAVPLATMAAPRWASAASSCGTATTTRWSSSSGCSTCATTSAC